MGSHGDKGVYRVTGGSCLQGDRRVYRVTGGFTG